MITDSTPRIGPAAWLDQPYVLLIRASLLISLVLGMALGLYLLLGLALGLPLPASTPVLIQVHGQAQIMGLVALFVVAAGVQLIPRFHATSLVGPRRVSVGGLALALGIALRALAQPLPDGIVRAVLLVGGALLALGGAIAVVSAFATTVRRAVERPGRRILLMSMAGLSLVAALALNVLISVRLAGGVPVAPFAENEALIHLQIWGFGATMVLMVGGRMFPRFLLLRGGRERLGLTSLVVWCGGIALVAIAWLLAAPPGLRTIAALVQLVGLVGYLVALRLYEPAVRASTVPHITDTTRRWTRVAFGFLLLAGALGVYLSLREAFGGAPIDANELSVMRHAAAQGFLLPLIVLMAARILPGYAGVMVERGRLLATMVWALFAGATLRVGAQLLGGYGGPGDAAIALGGTLTFVVYLIFAIGLWRSTHSTRAG